jgi:hypothetical protein
MKKIRVLFFKNKGFLLLALLVGVLFTSCNKEIDQTKQYYKFKSKETPIYSEPNGKIVGYFPSKHKLDCIENRGFENGWIKASLIGFKKEIYLHPDDMQKMTVTEVQAISGKPTILSKTWWARTTNYLDLPTTGLWPLWAALAFAVALIVCYYIKVNYYITMIFLLGLNASEYLYFMTYEGDRTWFFDFMGNTILYFVAFAIICVILLFQMKITDVLLEAFQEDGQDSYSIGKSAIYSVPVLIVFSLVSWFVIQVMGLPIIVAKYVEIAFFVVLSLIVIRYFLKADGLFNKLCAVTTYITSYTAIALTFTYNVFFVLYVIYLFIAIKNFPLILKTFVLGSGSPSPFKGASEGVRATINIRGYGTCTGTIYNDNYFENDSRTVIAVGSGNDWFLQEGFESRDETIERFNAENNPWV